MVAAGSLSEVGAAAAAAVAAAGADSSSVTLGEDF